MYKEIELETQEGKKTFPFLATGTTAYRYKQCFHQDLMIALNNMEDTADDQAQKPHHNSGSDGVPFCTGSNQVFLCFLHLPDQRKSCLKVKDKLPTKQIVSDPADKKQNCRPYNLHCHEKNASVFKGGLYLITT